MNNLNHNLKILPCYSCYYINLVKYSIRIAHIFFQEKFLWGCTWFNKETPTNSIKSASGNSNCINKKLNSFLFSSMCLCNQIRSVFKPKVIFIMKNGGKTPEGLRMQDFAISINFPGGHAHMPKDPTRKFAPAALISSLRLSIFPFSIKRVVK
jgi:hypothetical protein